MSDKKLLIKASLCASICGMLISIILLCIFASLMLAVGVLPEQILNYATIAVLAAGTFFGGFISARITKSAGLITGLMTGFIIFLLVTVIGITKSNDSITVLTLIKLLSTLAAGSLGGIVGGNKKEKIHIK